MSLTRLTPLREPRPPEAEVGVEVEAEPDTELPCQNSGAPKVRWTVVLMSKSLPPPNTLTVEV